MSLSAAALTGCLDTAPEYSVPEKLPPILDDAAAFPPITSLYAPPGQLLSLRIPMSVAEGSGRMQSFFVADYRGSNTGRQVCVDDPPAGKSVLTCEENYKNVPLDDGCHTITVLASYRDNFELGYRRILDPSLIARATWIVGVGPGADLCFPVDPGADQ